MSTIAKFPKASSVTIYSLGLFLGMIHILLGVIALTPAVSQDYHREIKLNYNAFAKSLTFLHLYADKFSIAMFLRYFISVSQTVFGVLLLENGHFGSFNKFGNYGLFVVDVIFLLFQLVVGSSYERVAPTVVFSILLITRLLIMDQSSKRVKVGVKTRFAGKQKTSTPKKNKNE